MAGKTRSYLVTAALVIILLALAFLVKTGQASFQFQTVPTEIPTQAGGQATNTQAPATQPTSAAATPVLINTQTLAPTAAGAVTENAAATATPLTAVMPSATINFTQTPAVKAQTNPNNPVPTDSGTNAASESWLKSIYFLICGLGLVAGIVIIVILAIRKANKSLKPPKPGPTG